jgi:hypothetical protein
MVIIAMTLYLPQHIAFLTNRAWFYYNGDESAKTSVHSVVQSATNTVLVVKAAAGSSILDAAKEL